MHQCPSCGAPNDDSARFCVQCGTRLNQRGEAQRAPGQPLLKGTLTAMPLTPSAPPGDGSLLSVPAAPAQASAPPVTAPSHGIRPAYDPSGLGVGLGSDPSGLGVGLGSGVQELPQQVAPWGFGDFGTIEVGAAEERPATPAAEAAPVEAAAVEAAPTAETATVVEPPSLEPEEPAPPTTASGRGMFQFSETIVHPPVPEVSALGAPSDSTEDGRFAPAVPLAPLTGTEFAASMPMQDGPPLSASPESLLAGLDAGFDLLLQGTGGPPSAVGDDSAARELFLQMAVGAATPLRDFLVEVELGHGSSAWVGVVRPVARNLADSARELGIQRLPSLLEDLLTVVSEAETAGPATLFEGELKERLRGAAQRLVDEFPEVFSVEGERDRREPLLVQALLEQVAGVGKVTLDKLFAAGFVQLEAFYKCPAADLSSLTGIPLELAVRVHARFISHRDEVRAQPVDGGRAAERAQLEEQTELLARLQQAFSRASTDARRELRRERQEVLARISVSLVRLGALELAQRVERAGYDRKIELLRESLRDGSEGATQLR